MYNVYILRGMGHFSRLLFNVRVLNERTAAGKHNLDNLQIGISKPAANERRYPH